MNKVAGMETAWAQQREPPLTEDGMVNANAMPNLPSAETKTESLIWHYSL